MVSRESDVQRVRCPESQMSRESDVQRVTRILGTRRASTQAPARGAHLRGDVRQSPERAVQERARVRGQLRDGALEVAAEGRGDSSLRVREHTGIARNARMCGGHLRRARGFMFGTFRNKTKSFIRL
jgi:hypothetical protein